jgi:rhomboid protease GluP
MGLFQRIWESTQGAPATWIVGAANVVYFLVAQSRGDTRQIETLIRFGATERERIWAGEYWRLLTSCFLHIGWVHLLWNTWVMFGWCEAVEQSLGSGKFAMAYLMTGIGASAVSVLMHTAVAAGASGAGFGMIGVILMISYRRLGGFDAFLSDPQVLWTLKMLALWFVIGMFLIRMDNYAHLGGLIFGAIIGFVITRDASPGDPAQIALYAGMALVWLAVVGASLNRRFARRDREGDDL